MTHVDLPGHPVLQPNPCSVFKLPDIAFWSAAKPPHRGEKSANADYESCQTLPVYNLLFV